MRSTLVSPHLLCAWHGPALLALTPSGTDSVSGFWFRETRFLHCLQLELDRQAPWLCSAGAPARDQLAFGFVHPELAAGAGGGSGIAGREDRRDPRGLPWRALELLVRYQVEFASFESSIHLANRAPEPVTIEAAWRLDADFADLLEALGEARQQFAPTETTWRDGTLRIRYCHTELPFETRVTPTGAGDWKWDGERLAARLALQAREGVAFRLRVEALDPAGIPVAAALAARKARRARWQASVASLHAPGEGRFAEIVNEAMRDLGSLALLEGAPNEWLAPAAGIPLYPALFGRDALTTGWQAASLDRGEMLDDALGRLGALQGTRVDPARDEEPGRIVHSVRLGPAARLGKNPYARYYGDFAGPLMFVVALAHLYSWTGDAKQLARHWDAARRALDWARDYGDRDGDGYLEYLTHAPDGPVNQGWKDSGDGIVYEDGTPVAPPLATCELQGYWYAAQQLMAVLCAARGARADAKAHWKAAAELKRRFNRDWWLADERYVALALDPDKRPVRSIASNAGHCLTSGIVSDGHLPPLVGRLFAPDMFSGWGIRTLSSGHPSYNPVSYHLGSVWPVENATIVFGLRRFGFDARAVDLATALRDLALLYDRGRIPECVGGYARAEVSHPGAYPRANAPQAWNQSGLVLVVHSLLGLQPVAPLDLLVVDPVLPEWLPELTIRDLRVGGARATVRFWRDEGGRSHAELVRHEGTLRLVRQPPPESLTVGVADRFRALLDGLLQ